MIDPELEAIHKSTELLKDLDEESRIRVIQYLVSRFKIGSNLGLNNKPTTETSTRLLPQKGKPTFENQAEDIETVEHDLPALKDIVAKDLPKTEFEWLLIYSLYASIQSDGFFTRDDMIEKYKESNRWTPQNRKNLSGNIKAVIRKDWIKSTNETQFIVKEEGKQYAYKILSGNSIGKTRKSLTKTNKKISE